MRTFKLSIFVAFLLFAINQVIISQPPVDPVVWKFKTSGAVYSTPLIKNDTMFIGSHDSCFYAIDLVTKQQLWKYKTKNPINTTASIYGNIICFGSGNYLYGLDLQGNLKWEFQMYEGVAIIQDDDWDYFNSSPNIVDSIAYIGTAKGLVYGVNLKNGVQVFKCEATDNANTVETTPVIFDGKIFFGNYNGFIYAYDLKTSQKVWEYDTNNDNHGRGTNIMLVPHALLYNNNVYFCGRGGYLYCFEPATGTKKWQYRDPSGLWILGLTREDSTFYMGSSYQFFIRSVNANTGQQNWITNINYISYGSPWVDSTYLFSGSGDDASTNKGFLYATNKKTGEIKNRISFSGRIQSSPIMHKDVLYVGCSDGFIYALNKQKMVNVEFPKIALKDKKIINYNNKPLNSVIDTSIYVFNIGKGTDSIVVYSDKTEMTVTPKWSFLKAGDSVKINIKINTTGLTAKKYSATVRAQSYYSMYKETLTKYINFELATSVGTSKVFDNNRDFNLFPNPLSGIGTIEYRLQENSNIHLSIYNGLGKEVLLIEKGLKNNGSHIITFR